MPGVVQPASPAGGRPSALQSAVLLQRVAPVYPPSALLGKVQGEVSVNATIGKDGVPKDLKLIKGDERLVLAAFSAVRPMALSSGHTRWSAHRNPNRRHRRLRTQIASRFS